jgi:hypothetical protein
MLDSQWRQAEELKEDMARHFWPMIGTANKTAYFAIEDAIEQMEAAGMMRQGQKKHARKAIEEMERYERLAYEHFTALADGRYALWQDLIGRAAGKLEPDFVKLRFAIKNVIDRAKVRESTALAYIQTALALITLATLMYDTMADQYQRQTMLPIRDEFAAGRLTAVERHWKQVGEITGRQQMANVNLRDDPQCILGVQVILTKYQQADFLNEAAQEALALNPETLEILNK